ncbi:MAG: hypothetical protein JO296_03510 [Pseudonocardiales bacterium]|nr:hypothetical protein [Pseudonocardiales bacterium]
MNADHSAVGEGKRVQQPVQEQHRQNNREVGGLAVAILARPGKPGRGAAVWRGLPDRVGPPPRRCRGAVARPGTRVALDDRGWVDPPVHRGQWVALETGLAAVHTAALDLLSQAAPAREGALRRGGTIDLDTTEVEAQRSTRHYSRNRVRCG